MAGQPHELADQGEPYFEQFDLGHDYRLQVAADGMITIHGTRFGLFDALPGKAHETENGTAWKQYGAVTFFRAH